MTTELIKSVVNRTDSKPIEKNQLFCYFAIMYTNLKLKEIGEIVHRKHSTVIYSRRVIINRRQTDKRYFEKVERLKMLCESVS